MKKPSIEELVMSRLFPQRKDIDPSDWQTHIRRSLIQEVRRETDFFYGVGDCLEAQYPGLDYAKPAHRLRLNRFPCHRKLFRVFDELRLTDYEIQRLCRWKGTRWDRETYEIKDTTWNGVQNRSTSVTVAPAWAEETVETELGEVLDNYVRTEGGEEDEDEDMRDEDEGEEPFEEESEDELQRSVGVDLNQRLLVAAEARARGEEATIDADWEQWLKETAENLRSTLTPADPSQTSLHWGLETPEYLIEDSATFRARLPPPSQYSPPVEANSAAALGVIAQQPAHPVI